VAVSAVPLPRHATLRAGPRRGLSVICFLLFGLCLVSLGTDAYDRRAWTAVAEERGLGKHQPAILETAGMIDESDAAGLVVAEALMNEHLSPPAAGGPESGAQVRSIVLRGVAGRPGSAFARLLLGRSASTTGARDLWAKPLELSVAAAPGLDLATSELARRYMAAWATLPTSDRPKAAATIRRAFRNPDFLRTTLVPALSALGPEVAIRVLPDDKATLRLAAQTLQEAGQTQASELLAARLKGPSVPPEASRSEN
jgi:hypothetical protein